MIHDMIGTTARLMPVRFGTALSEKVENRYSMQSARSRTWAFDTLPTGRTRRRQWVLNLDLLEESNLALIHEFTHGAYGPGPFRFLSASAQQSNVLTPSQSVLFEVDPVGSSMEVVGGWSPRSSTGPTSALLAQGVPVLPGGRATASADVSGAATLRMIFRSTTGLAVGTVESKSTVATVKRMSVSSQAVPATARTADIYVVDHVKASRPQLTWTEGAVPWAVGQGADSVVVTDSSWSLRQIKVRGGSWSSASVEIVEVG